MLCINSQLAEILGLFNDASSVS